jgi:predicted secreted protein
MRAFQMIFPVVIAGFLAVPALHAADDVKQVMDGTLVNLNAEAHKMVPQDRLAVTLSIQQTFETPQKAQAEVNKAMQAAKKIYDGYKDIKVTTGSYNVWKVEPYVPTPVKDSKAQPKKPQWQARQELNLDGADKDAVLDLMGKLQDKGFASDNMNFYLSREAYDAARDDLIGEALKSISARAKAVSGSLGMKTVQFQKIDINDGGNGPRPVMMRAMMAKGMDMAAEAMPAPVAQAGETDVTVQVSAEVKLK